MKLRDIFTQLTYGELSQVNLGGAAAGAISEENYPAVVSHINLGMTALHSRFALKEGTVSIPLVSGKYTYALPPDCLKASSVLTASGLELSLNNKGDALACSTPSASVLRVPVALVEKNPSLPSGLVTDSLSVVYRQSPVPIEINDFGIDPDFTEVDLPITHLQALLLFVAARVHSPGELSGQPLSYNSYFARYEAECMQLENLGLRLDLGGQTNRLQRNGWV